MGALWITIVCYVPLVEEVKVRALNRNLQLPLYVAVTTTFIVTLAITMLAPINLIAQLGIIELPGELSRLLAAQPHLVPYAPLAGCLNGLVPIAFYVSLKVSQKQIAAPAPTYPPVKMSLLWLLGLSSLGGSLYYSLQTQDQTPWWTLAAYLFLFPFLGYLTINLAKHWQRFLRNNRTSLHE